MEITLNLLEKIYRNFQEVAENESGAFISLGMPTHFSFN